MRNIHCESLGHSFPLADHPVRVVSLLSSATESIDRMGMADRIAGVSAYCHRYVPELKAPVVGEYLNCDIERIRDLDPDLILITGGIQRNLGLKLASMGLPIYLLPLPRGFHGILENQMIIGGLLGNLPAARGLCRDMSRRAETLYRTAPAIRPKVYLELWLGRHMRTVGGGTFIHDLLEMAGCDPVFGDRNEGYFTPDFREVEQTEPDIFLFFHEPEHLINPSTLMRERGWNTSGKIFLSGVECGQNLIQEGPSFIDTAEWLKQRIES